MASPARIDRDHVSLATEAARLYWETKLGAARDAIGEALANVGDSPAAITQWLTSHRKAHERLAERPSGA